MHLANENGQGIIAAIMIIFIVAVLGVTAVSLLGTEAGSSINYLYSQQALFIAEAGKEYVMGKLYADASYRASPTTVTQSFGIGSFTVTVSQAGSTYTLTSTGTVDIATRQITESVAITSSALSGAIHSDAASIDFDDSSGTVNGNIEAKNHISDYEDMTINGTITEGIEQINPALNFNTYKTIAQGQGKYYTSDLTFSNGTYSGAYYTTEKVTIGDNAVINGSIFAEGNIEFANRANNITISPANNYPALASQGSISTKASGSPKIGLQGSTINGLIYADNNITLDYLKNSVTINGTIIADNNINIKKGSNFTINYDSDIFSPMPSGFTYSGGDIAAIAQGDWDEAY